MKVFNVGTNDVPRLNGTRVYKAWANMLKRCYCKSYKKTRPSYEGASVCHKWLTLSNFKAWMESQDHEGKDLDKDIIKPGNKIYSPETCCFVDKKINSLLIKCVGKEKPKGYTYDKSTGKYISQLRVCGANKYLGSFESKELAAKAYRVGKSNLLIEMACLVGDQRVSDGLMKHAEITFNV